MTRISASRINMEDGRIDNAYLRDYGETVVGGSAGTNAGASYTVDMENGNVFNLILNSATCTLTFSNASVRGTMCSFTLILKQDATGGRVVTWPSNVLWPDAIAPVLTPVASRFDYFVFQTITGGGLWFGSVAGQNYA